MREKIIQDDRRTQDEALRCENIYREALRFLRGKDIMLFYLFPIICTLCTSKHV